MQFYLRVRALLASIGPQPVVLDFGAGRGVGLDHALPVHRELFDLRDRAKQVIGVDVDSSVLSNPGLTDAHVIGIGGELPLQDGSIDLVLADHVFEHLGNPLPVCAELRRVLREGGWICARTPNKWGYIALGARAVPNHRHASVLRRVQPARDERDVFPTKYRLNSRADIAKAFPTSQFEHIIYGWEPEPAYVGSSRTLELLFQGLSRLTPERLRPILLVFLQRKPSETRYRAS